MRAIDNSPTWRISLVPLALIFLGCAPCIDDDLDGFGSNVSIQCTYAGAVDCDDENPDVHPGAREGGMGHPTCSDGLDNDCDGLVDAEDPDCRPPCTDNDGDGYGNPGSASCTHLGQDCDDSNPDVNPGATEGPAGDPTCTDGLDNNCDGFVDEQDPGCQLPCTDNDLDGYGNPASPNCIYPEQDCDDSNPDVNPGATEGPAGDSTCSDGLDNNCDGLVDLEESGCSVAQIPGGCFDMGDAFDEAYDDELPVHNVCVTAFEMDAHEVTNGEYAACVGAGACSAPGNSFSRTRASYYGNLAYKDFPVIYVSWFQASEYCAWAGKRLPTETEWEYAARGGLAGKRYPWGDAISCDDANYYRNAFNNPCWDYAGRDNDTQSVGTYAPNGYGLSDVAGNVSEWVSDWYGEFYYQECVDNGIVNDPPGPTTGTFRILRGGEFRFSEAYLRVAYRIFSISHLPSYQREYIGFRCARGGAYGP